MVGREIIILGILSNWIKVVGDKRLSDVKYLFSMVIDINKRVEGWINGNCWICENCNENEEMFIVNMRGKDNMK